MADTTELPLLRQAHENLLDDHRELKAAFEMFKKEQQATNTSVATQLAVLVVKAGAWGSIAAAVVTISALLLRLF